jgi:hypothetical protein
MKYLIYLFSLLLAVQVSAQDILKLTDKTELQTKVIEVMEQVVKYKRFDNIDGPTYTISKGKIFQIVYQNGVIENYTKTPVNKLVEKTNPQKAVTQTKPPEIKKPVFKKYTSAEYEAEKKKMYSEKKSLYIPSQVYKYALMKVPNIPVYTQDKVQVNLADFLKSKPEFSTKPTLIITWAFSWGEEGVKKIDTLISNYDKFKDNFNIVLLNTGEVNRDLKPRVEYGIKSIDKVKEFLFYTRDDFYAKTTMLFDVSNEMANYNNGGTGGNQLIFWVDTNLNIRTLVPAPYMEVKDIKKVFNSTFKLPFTENMLYANFYEDYKPYISDRPSFSCRRLKIGNIIQLKFTSPENENITFATYYFEEYEDNNVASLGSNNNLLGNNVSQTEAKCNGDWNKYVERNINANVPFDNGAPAGVYKVILNFIVDIDGNISSVFALNDPGYGTKEEAIRLITRGLSWTPAVKNGRKVISNVQKVIQFTVPHLLKALNVSGNLKPT